MIIAVTGHRPDKLGNEWGLNGPYSNFIRTALQRIITNTKPEVLISGMALGVDTIWALLAIENGIKLTAAIPCQEHSSKWTESSKKLYNEILSNPLTTTHLVSDTTYNNTCMQKRNEYMVDACDMLVGVWDGTSGGTANCMRYAESKDKTIIRINPILK